MNMRRHLISLLVAATAMGMAAVPAHAQVSPDIQGQIDRLNSVDWAFEIPVAKTARNDLFEFQANQAMEKAVGRWTADFNASHIHNVVYNQAWATNRVNAKWWVGFMLIEYPVYTAADVRGLCLPPFGDGFCVYENNSWLVNIRKRGSIVSVTRIAGTFRRTRSYNRGPDTI